MHIVLCRNSNIIFSEHRLMKNSLHECDKRFPCTYF